MGLKEFEFEIIGLPKTTNSGGRAHWTAKVKEAQKWKRAVYIKCLQLGVLHCRPIAKAKIVLIRCSSREPDFDGLVSSFKHVLDGLVEAGIIESDKMSVIGQPEYRWEKCLPHGGYIKVRVEEVI